MFYAKISWDNNIKKYYYKDLEYFSTEDKITTKLYFSSLRKSENLILTTKWSFLKFSSLSLWRENYSYFALDEKCNNLKRAHSRFANSRVIPSCDYIPATPMTVRQPHNIDRTCMRRQHVLHTHVSFLSNRTLVHVYH